MGGLTLLREAPGVPPQRASLDASDLQGEPRAGLRMCELPPEGRPRERLLAQGGASLSEAELVAILLGTGSAESSALGLAHELLAHHAGAGDGTGLRGLARLSAQELNAHRGVGPAKAARLLAALELGARLGRLGAAERVAVEGPEALYRLLAPRLRHARQELLLALHLDHKHRVVHEQVVAVGGLNAVMASPREVFAEALRRNAGALALAHNHPSGDPTPSADDLALTARLMEAGELLGVRVLDHIVVGDGGWVSLRRHSPELWGQRPFHK